MRPAAAGFYRRRPVWLSRHAGQAYFFGSDLES